MRAGPRTAGSPDVALPLGGPGAEWHGSALLLSRA